VQLSDISLITADLLYTYAACVKIMKCFILGDETNLLEPCFGSWIIHVWSGYLRHLGA